MFNQGNCVFVFTYFVPGIKQSRWGEGSGKWMGERARESTSPRIFREICLLSSEEVVGIQDFLLGI